MYLYIL